MSEIIGCTSADKILLYPFVNIRNILTVSCSWPQITISFTPQLRRNCAFFYPICSYAPCGCVFIGLFFFAACADLICVRAASWTGSTDKLLHCNFSGRSSSYPMSTQYINQDKSVIFPWICVLYHLMVISFLPPTVFFLKQGRDYFWFIAL